MFFQTFGADDFIINYFGLIFGGAILTFNTEGDGGFLSELFNIFHGNFGKVIND
jgi:hypothetical protein